MCLFTRCSRNVIIALIILSEPSSSAAGRREVMEDLGGLYN